MKKILATFLVLTVCLGLSCAFAAGKEFIDVKTSDWFYNDVQSAVELGLVNGKSDTTYVPNDNLTYAEAVKLAACMHQLYTTGKVELEAGDPWYMPYADYCKDNGITNKEYNYSENVTRAGYMGIFANALPGDGLKEINRVANNSIPDVPSSEEYAEGVYKLYRAGILQGVDGEHNCNPFNNITRAEVATILVRMMDPEKRVTFTMGEDTKPQEKEESEPFVCVSQPIGGAIEVGGTIAASVTTEGGTMPLIYKWEYNTGSGWEEVTSYLGKVSGQDSPRVSIKSPAPVSYKVRCVITDSKGNEAISDAVDFIFNPSLSFAKQPSDATAEVGEAMTVSVEASGGTPPYKYEWIRKVPSGKNYVIKSLIGAEGVTGADTAEMTYVTSEASTSEVYCEVVDALGKKVTSDTVKLVATSDEKEEKEPQAEEPKAELFELVKSPKSTTVGLMEPAVCEVEVKGGVAPYTYQWYFECEGTWNELKDENVSGLEGATTERISLTRDVPETLKVRCVIIDSKRTKITTPAATITMEDKNALEIVTQPVTATVKVGEDAKLSVETKGGSDEITYQWQWDMSEKGGWIKMTENDVWSGTTTPELTVKSNAAANLLIRCVITDTVKNVRVETESVRVIFE